MCKTNKKNNCRTLVNENVIFFMTFKVIFDIKTIQYQKNIDTIKPHQSEPRKSENPNKFLRIIAS